MKRGPRLALSIPTTCDPFQGGRFVTYLHRTPRSAKHSLVKLSRNRFEEITLNKSASIRQPHWNLHLDEKRPTRGCDAANSRPHFISARSRLLTHVDCFRLGDDSPGGDGKRDECRLMFAQFG